MHKIQQAPDGSQLHMFMGPEAKGSMPYCHATQHALNPALASKAARMNEKQRIDFFLAESNQGLLFSLYDNLASAQEFKLIHTNAGTLGKATPAFLADFSFRIPQGFIYRVRSHYTFWPKGQFSMWCQAVSRNEYSANDTFLRNLGIFQKITASVKIAP